MTYEEIKAQSLSHWEELNNGETPLVRIGTAMCGHAAGGFRVKEALQADLQAKNIRANINEVGCLGICYAEPIVDIKKPGRSRILLRNVQPDEVGQLVEDYLSNDNLPEGRTLGYLGSEGPIGSETSFDEIPGIALQQRIALRNGGHIAPDDILQYVALGGYDGLNKALNTLEPSDVIEEVKKSGLRGRGGAAFPTGVKWSFLVGSPGPTKYILCNCEEGDPGAYNDKGILESDPYTLLEGLTIAGYATGASNGIVFIRHGHDGPIDRTEKAIEQAYKHGLLGKNILGSEFSFDIEVALTGESYVCLLYTSPSPRDS